MCSKVSLDYRKHFTNHYLDLSLSKGLFLSVLLGWTCEESNSQFDKTPSVLHSDSMNSSKGYLDPNFTFDIRDLSLETLQIAYFTFFRHMPDDAIEQLIHFIG